MKNSKSTKRTLLASMMSFVLCVAMLLGTTFAWFTDTASTSVNTIQSGTLKIALEMATAWNADGNPTAWEDANKKELEFKKAVQGEAVLWEPGCTYNLPELRITNTGNLALKYKVEISGINGSDKLNEVIDWTIDGADIGTEYHLLAGDSEQITIAGHMQETAGNDYQNQSIDSVSIKVYAVQDAVEHDSFGNTYDAKADGTPQFATWLKNVSVSGTVTSNGDTVLKDRETDPTVSVTIPAGSTTAEEVTLVKTETETPANITVETGTTAVSAEVKLVDGNGNKINAASGKFFVLTMQAEKNVNVIGFYHNGAEVTAAASADEVAATNDRYYYEKNNRYCYI